MSRKRRKMHVAIDGALSFQTPDGVPMVETFCARFISKDFAVLAAHCRAWMKEGYSQAIFCKFCLIEMEDLEPGGERQVPKETVR